MSVKYVVTTSTGLTFSYNERWTAEERAKSLMNNAGELRVPFRVNIAKITEEQTSSSYELLATFEAS